ncbi:hypothetical protein [Nubsella zeaxanthinifaciens]|uniref:hypothetical protein n=1 Tax=Nubsella zeaxanthinifaciens TaxID=392412 RepID=UPI000DE1AEA8|nr:hypothetical protein [Nubsella zeaxanthinifaciens]
MSKKYSDIKNKLKLEISKTENNDLAYLTHFFQNHKNGVSEYYKPTAKTYLTDLHDKLSIVEEPDFQYYLPIKWDVPFPPPTTPKFKFIDLILFQPFSIAGVSKKNNLGVILKGRALRSNLLLVPHKRISTTIPNALKQVV